MDYSVLALGFCLGLVVASAIFLGADWYYSSLNRKIDRLVSDIDHMERDYE